MRDVSVAVAVIPTQTVQVAAVRVGYEPSKYFRVLYFFFLSAFIITLGIIYIKISFIIIITRLCRRGHRAVQTGLMRLNAAQRRYVRVYIPMRHAVAKTIRVLWTQNFYTLSLICRVTFFALLLCNSFVTTRTLKLNSFIGHTYVRSHCLQQIFLYSFL